MKKGKSRNRPGRRDLLQRRTVRQHTKSYDPKRYDKPASEES